MSEVALLAQPTVEDEVAAAAQRLWAAGVEEPFREALEIWCAVAGKTLSEVWKGFRTPAPGPLVSQFHDRVSRRAAGEPLQYVCGICGFRTLELKIDRRALIPRPETEGLVELVLTWSRERWGESSPWGTALDLGTGSGCIALSLAVEGRFRRVVATDASPEALALARENLLLARPQTPVELREGSWFGPVQGERFDVIVCNPPYVASPELATVEPGVKEFEPGIALDGGSDGMSAIEHILRQGHDHIAPGGLLALEIDARRSEAVRRAAHELGWAAVRIEADLWGRARYLLAQPGGTP